MRSAHVFAPALLLTLAAASLADRSIDSAPLYEPTGVWGYLNKPKVKEELKITKDQDKDIQARLNKSLNLREELDAIAKITGPGKEGRIRAYKTKRAEEVFRSIRPVLEPKQEKRLKQIMLQQWGMGLFDHPEIRKALRISDKEVKSLRAAFDQLEKDVGMEIKAKRMSPKEAHAKFSHLAFGVPDRIRQLLTEAQRKTLKDLLGEPCRFDP